MNSNTLTNKQLMILEFIKEQLLSKGYPPSVDVDLRPTAWQISLTEADIKDENQE